MNFVKYKRKIEDGDTVILYLGFTRLMAVSASRGKTLQTKYGALRHDNMIGQEYGSKVKCSKGWLYALHPTPELWTMTLPHRTQILYSTDISMVTLQLELKPGSVVVESGTGSASLSHAILRSVFPTGHLHTFDFHEQRSQQARQEFHDHGFADLVTVKHRDVCKDGFDLEGVADAVFLDLPSPWEALPHAKRAIKKSGGRLCSFSPCIEQVQRACATMADLGFQDIMTSECLVRDYSVYTVNMDVSETWPGYPDSVPGVATARPGEPSVGVLEMSGEGAEGDDVDSNDDEDSTLDMPRAGSKRPYRKGHQGNKKRKAANSDEKQERNRLKFRCKSMVPRPTAHGHTGFLTFATLLPRFPAEVKAHGTQESVAADILPDT